jgi:hypothetical protein
MSQKLVLMSMTYMYPFIHRYQNEYGNECHCQEICHRLSGTVSSNKCDSEHHVTYKPMLLITPFRTSVCRNCMNLCKFLFLLVCF